ncbi:hypothetical protein [Natronobacterium gregoryi]|uniref:Winged helix-turn-helix domain-containing protein n=2 Tax=Natronobacterium gregoryi TaxID=44930 RepID=L0AGP5_NATGS|nr:hypothetical protein [Natronobacterium gregoryi]AFZ72986.1 hypothetical protein Natgr_1793 [Natronobacterium gregoryi SP2]ELY70082.1 hypothetical protein C490_06949 [Natronobacterium gregoryi SP2]PLK19091.1 winged helix-turn-helix domain-containing protein [Natronobacterium gregoryi SP2]SFJ62246.1 hypothetical protein SAMN05443661_1485 [Natronobacterium gregoryi]
MAQKQGDKTELQRDILLTWYENPDATKKEIAEACDCSASYVSNVTNRFDNYDHMEAMLDRQDKELEEMFGDDIFSSIPDASGPSGPGLIEIYSQQPDNVAGYLVRGVILAFMLFIFYQMALVLI